MIRESPDDEDRWLVFEDWLLEQDDARAEIVRLEKSGDRGAAAQARGRLHPLLLGRKEKTLLSKLVSVEWRAGFIRTCSIALPDRGWAEILRELVNAPAAALLRGIDLPNLPNVPLSSVSEALAILGAAPFAPWLRTLSMGFAYTADAGEIAAELDPLARLERLEIDGPADIRHTAALEHVQHLSFMPATREALAGVFVPSSLRSLRELVMDAGELERAGTPQCGGELRSLLDGSAAPTLQTFKVYWADAVSVRELLAALERSKLLPRLRVLSFGGPAVVPRELPPRYQTSLRHLVARTERSSSWGGAKGSIASWAARRRSP